MKLNELFTDTDVNVNWSNGMGMFELEGIQYLLQFLSIDAHGGAIRAAIPNQPEGERTYFFSFATMSDSGMPTDARTGAGQSIKVFSIVLQELEKQVQSTGADTIYFGGTTGDPARLRLYQKLIDKYTKKHSWSIVSTTTVNLFGDTQKVWVAQKTQ